MKLENGYYKAEDIIAAGLPTTEHKVRVKSATGTWVMRTHHSTPGAIYVENSIAYLCNEQDCIKFCLRDMPEGNIWRQVVETHMWPYWAEVRLDYRLKAWPLGFETYTKFFRSTEEAMQYIIGQQEWAQLEDNVFEIDKIQVWDLGPNVVTEEQLA